MYHSITFHPGGHNTWDTWRLIPTSRPVFNPPEFNSRYAEIPGGNGAIDMSTVLSHGHPTYKNREGSFEFIVPHPDENNGKEWYTVYNEIMYRIHGRSMRAFLEDDPEYEYRGRFTVDEWNSNESHSKIVIGYNVSPFKWAIEPEVKTIETLTSVSDQTYLFSYPDSLGQAAVHPVIKVGYLTEGATLHVGCLDWSISQWVIKDITATGTYQFAELTFAESINGVRLWITGTPTETLQSSNGDNILDSNNEPLGVSTITASPVTVTVEKGYL